ncbi:MAG: hypothetical protein ACJAYI_001160 [Myxococcota bacterium]
MTAFFFAADLCAVLRFADFLTATTYPFESNGFHRSPFRTSNRHGEATWDKWGLVIRDDSFKRKHTSHEVLSTS